MKSSRSTLLEEKILSQLMDEIYEDRSEQYPGVTQLIQCITKTYWERVNGRGAHDRTTKLYFTIGLGLERALLKAQKEGIVISGELDGIFYHIDGMEAGGIAEMKSTRMGTRVKIDPDLPPRAADNYKDIDVEDLPSSWLKQLKAYCKVKGTTKGSLIVIHVIQPDIRGWEIEFTQEEIDKNWNYLIRRRQILEMSHEYGRPPKPFLFNEAWECKNCTWKLMCEVNKDVS